MNMNEYNFLHIICNGCLAKVQVQGSVVVSKYRSSHHNNFSWTFGNIRNASNWVGALLLWKIQLEGIHIVIDKKLPAHLAAPTYVVSCESSFCLLLIPATSCMSSRKHPIAACTASIMNYTLPFWYEWIIIRDHVQASHNGQKNHIVRSQV